MCKCPCSENQNNLEELIVAGKVAWDSQQPTTPQDNPACFTVNDNEQMFMMSGNPAYGTIDEHNQQPSLQNNHVYVNVSR